MLVLTVEIERVANVPSVVVVVVAVFVVLVVVEVVVVVDVEERQGWIHASSSRCLTIPLKFSALACAQY